MQRFDSCSTWSSKLSLSLAHTTVIPVSCVERYGEGDGGKIRDVMCTESQFTRCIKPQSFSQFWQWMVYSLSRQFRLQVERGQHAQAAQILGMQIQQFTEMQRLTREGGDAKLTRLLVGVNG